MNFGELKARVLADAHRPDLTADVGSFVERAEEMIRRDLRADTYSVTLDEDDRVAGGVYTIPSTVLEIRSVVAGGRPLEQVGLSEIARSRVEWSPVQYCVHGSTIEIKGVPGDGAEIQLRYFGHPAPLSSDGDTNDLLTMNPTLYIEGALFFLHKHCENLELAQAALDTFSDALQKLNEAAGRKLGGARMQGVYHFGPIVRGY